MPCDNCEIDNMVQGNNVDVYIDRCASEIRADVTLSEYSTIRIWGQVKNCHGRPICGVLLKLVKAFEDDCHKIHYEGIAHTTSDKEGFYQFEVCAHDNHKHYKILANKALFSRCY